MRTENNGAGECYYDYECGRSVLCGELGNLLGFALQIRHSLECRGMEP